MKNDFDWSVAPQPWNWIGPEFRETCEQIAADKPPSRPQAIIDGYVARSAKGRAAQQIRANNRRYLR